MSAVTNPPASVTFQIPINFKAGYLIDKYGTPKNNLKQELKNVYKHRERLMYIVHLIVRNRGNEGVADNQYINLCSKVLKHVFAQYISYRDYLVEHGVIESDDEYCNYKGKEKCKGYRMTKKYRGKKLRFENCFDANLVKKLKVNDEEQTKIAIEKYPELCKKFSRLDYDKEEAKKILNKLYTEKEEEKRNQQELKLSKIEKKEGNFIVGRTGRLYTPISNLKKELRPALRVNGEKLVGLDIKASIPTILEILLSIEGARIFDEKIRKYSNYGNLIGAKKGKKPQQGLGRGQLGEEEYKMEPKKPYGSEPYMWANFGGLLDMEDVIRFRKDISTGDIYNIYMEKFNELMDKDKKKNRREIKKIVLSIINSPKYCDSGHKDLLKAMYPNVIKIIDEINGYFKISQNGVINDDVAPIAYITQEIESDFVLGTVCKRIVSDRPEVPIFTIHDAIYTTREHVEYLKQLMLEESVAYFGRKICVEEEVL